MKLLACSANQANLKRRFHWPNVAITRSACLGAKQENKSCRGSLKTKVLLLVHLVHVSGQRRQAATQERAVGVGLWGEGKRRYPCAPRRRGARPRRRELTGETRTLRGSKHDGLGETKAVGKKQRGLQVRGFIGRRERHAYETGSSLSTFVSCFLSPPSLPLSL